MADVTDDDVLVSNETNRSGEDYSRGHSVQKPLVTKKVPHYLRASTGSCHDACKHGHPHKIKEKSSRPALRRMSTPLADGKKTVDIQIYVDKKAQKRVQPDKVEFPSAKELAPANGNSRKSLPSPRRSPVHDSSKPVKQGSYTKSPSPKVPKVINKVVPSSRKSSFMSNTTKIPKVEVAKNSASSKRIPLSPKERNALVGSVKLDSSSMKVPSMSHTLKTSYPEVASVAKKYVSSKLIPLTSKARNGSEAFIKPNGRGEKPSCVDSLTRLMSKQTSETKVAAVKPAAFSTRVEVKKPIRPTTAGIGLKGWSHKTQVSVEKKKLTNKTELKEAADVQKVEEKTLHRIETKEDDLLKAHDDVLTTPNASLLVQPLSPLSPETLNSSSQTTSLSFTSHEAGDDQHDLDSEYTDSEADGSVSNYNSAGNSKPADSLKEGKEVIHDSEGPLELKFRKGTVVEDQSETNSPRRLKFRQGRTLGDEQDTNDGAQRKSYRKLAAESEKKEADTGVVKVVLKHQEMEMKKDEQVLLNNVIEEAASKLVEKRKSKVKALVGAFESVISLQERKPSAADR